MKQSESRFCRRRSLIEWRNQSSAVWPRRRRGGGYTRTERCPISHWPVLSFECQTEIEVHYRNSDGLRHSVGRSGSGSGVPMASVCIGQHCVTQ